MNFLLNLNIRRPCMLLSGGFLMVALMFYFAFERLGAVSYVQEHKLQENVRYSSENIDKQSIQGTLKTQVNMTRVHDEKKDRIETSGMPSKTVQTSSTMSSIYSSTQFLVSSSPSAHSVVTKVTAISVSSQQTAGTLDTKSTANSASPPALAVSPVGKFTAKSASSSPTVVSSRTERTVNSKISDFLDNLTDDFNPFDTDPSLTERYSALKNFAKTAEYNYDGLNETQEEFPTFKQVHIARIQNIKNVCQDKDKFQNTTVTVRTSTVMYIARNYNFTYCKVPKSGSTFWTKAFGVLTHGVTYGERIFKTSRSGVHNTMREYQTKLDGVISDQTRTILVSRNPYSRLFSAYIDKSFLNLYRSLNYRIRGIQLDDTSVNDACLTDVTFQEFLDWVLSEIRNRKSLDRHWAPIVSLCHPCVVNPFILVKQETFSRDVEYALRTLGVEKDKYDYIASALHDHRVELSLPGIIDTLFTIAGGSYIVRNCLGYAKFFRRIWISLQIQGHVKETIEFPVEKFSVAQFSNKTYFTEIVLQTIHDFPVSSTQSKSQRQKFLQLAYMAVKPNTLKGIQELYRQDFELFGYSKLPPTYEYHK